MRYQPNKPLANQSNKLDYAHFNPQELSVLDTIQGGPTYLPGTNIKHYSAFENPAIEAPVMKAYEQHAKGGKVGEMLHMADLMRKRGRNGDSEIALVGPKFTSVLKKVMNGGSINPMTKKPEFFNLGGLFKGIGHTLGGITGGIKNAVGGIGHTLGGIANGVGGMVGMPHLGDQLGNAIPGALMGGLEGGPMGALMGGGADLLGNSLMGGGGGQAQQPQEQQQMPSSLGAVGQQFMNSPMGQQAMNKGNGLYSQFQNMYNKGNNMYNQANQNYQHMAGAFNSSPMAQQMGYSAPSSFQDIQQHAMNTPMGRQATNMGNNMYGHAQNAYGQAQNMYNQADQNYSHMANAYNNPQQSYGGQSGGYGSQGGYGNQDDEDGYGSY